MITLTTVGKPQGISIYIRFVILTDEYFRFYIILPRLVFYCNQKATKK